MFDTSKYVSVIKTYDFQSFERTIGDYVLIINVGRSPRCDLSNPPAIIDLSKYKTICLEIIKGRGLISEDEADKIGVNKFIAPNGYGHATYYHVDINYVEKIENTIATYQNLILDNKNIYDVQPCCKCGMNDKWNSFNNGKWFCYKHCSY